MAGEGQESSGTSYVGSYSSTKWFEANWIVKALLPTPPLPQTTILISSESTQTGHPAPIRYGHHCHGIVQTYPYNSSCSHLVSCSHAARPSQGFCPSRGPPPGNGVLDNASVPLKWRRRDTHKEE